MEAEKKQLVKRSAMERMANRLQVSRDVLEKTLKATVCRGTKLKDGKGFIPMTNEEFVSFIAVANNYKLNPLTKEIYAYPDTKSAGIIPIVSTDGWNKLMTTHPNYKTHYYRQPEKMAKIGNSKLCPEWMEIVIVKKDDSEVVVREYLDECYNGGKKYKNGDFISSPWDSHTKRMLRHKTKIQGAREAFGFGGIYDQDEGDRIIEAHLVEDEPAGKPRVSQPKALSESPEEPQQEKTQEERIADMEKDTKKNVKQAEKKTKPDSAYAEMIKGFEDVKSVVGDEIYYETLGANSYEHANQIKKVAEGAKIIEEMLAKKKDA